jgi:excisionase family DNA binding protein
MARRAAPIAPPSAEDVLVDKIADRVAQRVLAILDERERAREKLPERAKALRMDEVGRRLGLSEREVHRQVMSGAMRSLKVGRVRLIPLAAVDEFLARFEEAS